MKAVWENPLWKRLDANKVARELLQISGDTEAIQPEQVVERARDPSSYLHKAFEWDRDKAAGLWVLNQARSLIRSIRIVIKEPEGDRKQRMYVHVFAKEGSTYVTPAALLSNEELYKLALDEALRLLNGIQARYNELKELKPVWRALRKIKKQKMELVTV